MILVTQHPVQRWPPRPTWRRRSRNWRRARLSARPAWRLPFCRFPIPKPSKFSLYIIVFNVRLLLLYPDVLYLSVGFALSADVLLRRSPARWMPWKQLQHPEAPPPTKRWTLPRTLRDEDLQWRCSFDAALPLAPAEFDELIVGFILKGRQNPNNLLFRVIDQHNRKTRTTFICSSTIHSAFLQC